MISEIPSSVQETTESFIPSIPFQPSFPEMRTCEPQIREVRAQQFSVNSKTLTHKDLELQPYLLPYPLVDRVYDLIQCIGAASEHYRYEDRENYPSLKKVEVFKAIRKAVKDTPFYVKADDSPELKMSHPLHVKLGVAYGNLYSEWQKDPDILELLENERKELKLQSQPEGFVTVNKKGEPVFRVFSYDESDHELPKEEVDSEVKELKANEDLNIIPKRSIPDR